MDSRKNSLIWGEATLTPAVSPTSTMQGEIRAAALQEHKRLESRLAELSAAARKETQIARQADINLELKRRRTDRDVARTNL